MVNPLVMSEDISIHLPRAGQDQAGVQAAAQTEGFQSTCPVRGRTKSQDELAQSNWISIHLPRAGQDAQGRMGSSNRRNFNPPAPCGAGPIEQRDETIAALFQSTCPVRGRTPPESPLGIIPR